MAESIGRWVGIICGALWLGVASSATPALELARNGSFESGYDDWWPTSNLAAHHRDGQLCVDVPGGTRQPWDANIVQARIGLKKNERYVFSFHASGDPAGPVRAVIQMPHDPYTDYVEVRGYLTAEAKLYSRAFTSPVDRQDATLVIQLGGSSMPWTFCLDDVSVRPEAEAKAAAMEEVVASETTRSAGPMPSMPTQSVADSVLCVQESVLVLGHDPGPLDGLLGRRTEAAALAAAAEFELDMPGFSSETAAPWCAALRGALGVKTHGSKVGAGNDDLGTPPEKTGEPCNPYYKTPVRLIRVATQGDLSETAVGDFDGDGLSDVIIARMRFRTPDAYEISILLNDKKQGLRDGTRDLFGGDIPRTIHPTKILLADFNGDGRLDAYIADFGMDKEPFPGHQNTLC